MNEQIFERGSFKITNKILSFSGTTINLSSVDNFGWIDWPRHSYFSGVKTWLKLLTFFFVICSLSNTAYWLFGLCLGCGLILIAYNIYEHQKIYYAICLKAKRDTFYIKSDDILFIKKVEEAIQEAMNHSDCNYVINIDNHNIVNNGIVSNGDNNYNEVRNDNQ